MLANHTFAQTQITFLKEGPAKILMAKNVRINGYAYRNTGTRVYLSVHYYDYSYQQL